MNKETLSNKEAAKFDVKISPANMKKLSEIYKELGIDFTFPIRIKDENDNETYYETSSGYWARREYDEDSNKTYYETSDGYWARREYDREYDKDGNETYYENSDGYWYRCEYNENGNETYFENSKGINLTSSEVR
jgi:hypothetical protein